MFYILFKVSDVVSTFCLILEFPHRTNHCVRADCIQTLIQLEYPPELICKLTGERIENVRHHILNYKNSGHKDTRSLKNYDPALNVLHKLDMMAGIMQGGAGQRGEFYFL